MTGDFGMQRLLLIGHVRQWGESGVYRRHMDNTIKSNFNMVRKVARAI